MFRPTSAVLPAIAVLALASTPDARADTGHCQYKQYAPKLRLWYPVCQMPASSKAECEGLISANRAQVEFGEGECSSKGVAAVCVVGGSKIFFYQGNETDLKHGCEGALRGAWRADLVPGK